MFNILLTLFVISLFYAVIVIFAKIIEKLREHKGEALNYYKLNKTHSVLFLIFGILFFAFFGASFKYLEYAVLPESASNFGSEIDSLFYITALITGVVFILTHIAMFAFVYLYRGRKNRKATFFAHSGNLEILWTSVPALAMAVLVVMGLNTWFKIFPNKKNFNEADTMIIEVTGKQFNWIVRYPGPDGKLGRRVISKQFITPDNELGVDWNDPASKDDFFASEIHLIKGKKVRFNLGALDVLHSFYLPHFRLKLDCVPGVPTSIGFTPVKTNDETREELKSNKYWSSIDPETGEPRFTKFTFELACAELCGKSHYGMLTNVIVEDETSFNKWLASQKSHYSTLTSQKVEKEIKTDSLTTSMDSVLSKN
jgi:cytochrome c oxidase subunit 2